MTGGDSLTICSLNPRTLLLFTAGMLFICLPVLPAAVSAQTTGLGVTAGFNTSSHFNNFRFQSGDIDMDINPEFTMGYNVGLSYRYTFHPNVRIQIEPSVIRLGAGYNDTFMLRDFEFHSESRTELTYLHLPLLLQLTTPPPDRREFPLPWAISTYHLSAGIYGGYLLDAVFSGSNTGTPIGVDFSSQFSNDVSGQFSEYNGGAILGVGTEYGRSTLAGAEMRLIYGILNAGDQPGLDFNPHNIAVTFSLYFMF